MATGDHNLKKLPDDLRKQLALAVKSIQWSYAIFWSISTTQPGVLEWGEGFYNGDIKTRKTVQAGEINADELGLQRSDQLRELYESLHLGETNPQAKRPTAALSPEDLTDAEWYFLVCMSFTFNVGQGLPGTSLAKNQTVWLCNAHRTDTKVFSRSLLAKSASIQTIVCFSHLGGVVELGTTELVPEDLYLIQHIRTEFLGSPDEEITTDNYFINEGLDQQANITENGLNTHVPEYPEMIPCSPGSSSDDFADNILRDESDFLEVIEGEVAQTPNVPLITDDAISNCLNNSMNSSDCISQTNGNPIPISDGTNINNFHGIQECNQQIPNSEHVHYQSVLSNLLKSSQQLILGPHFRNGVRESNFVGWRKDAFPCANVSQTGTRPQSLLKKVLFDVAKMHENSRLESSKSNGKRDRLEFDDADRNHVMSERKRREKMNERFTILGSLVPSGGKNDKISILDHTIEYLRDLERKVEELQAGRNSTTLIKPRDAIERTSDNYGTNSTSNGKKPFTNKRKSCDLIEKSVGAENSRLRLKDLSTDNVSVKITAERDVLIEMSCCWRESILLDAMEAINKLRLDLESVQSSNVDELLSISIRAKGKGLKVASANVIKQALQKVIRRA